MLKFNTGYNTFDSDSYAVHLDNPTEPNLFRDIFPYTEVPRIGFNHRLSPMRVPPEIWITDTTFRDGQQSMPPYTVIHGRRFSVVRGKVHGLKPRS